MVGVPSYVCDTVPVSSPYSAASRGTDGGDHLLAVLVPAFAVAGDERGFRRRELTRRA